MQSIFRLPGLASWSQPAATAALDKVSFAPVANGPTPKRKRGKQDSLPAHSSPQPVVKRMKAAPQQQQESKQTDGGAVQILSSGNAPEGILRADARRASVTGTQHERFATAGAEVGKPSALPNAGSASYTAALAGYHSIALNKSPLVPLAPNVSKMTSGPQYINTSISATKAGAIAKSTVTVKTAPSHLPSPQFSSPLSTVTVARAQPVLGIAPITPVTPSTANGFLSTTNKSPSSHPISLNPVPKRQKTEIKSAANMTVDNDMLRSVIEAEICQAILFKHNELRLIDQEMAKCQVALEQLRRCAEIPYLGSQGPSLQVSTHSGPALATKQGLIPPTSAAPWGVTDGPYTQHYASWLLPSSRFDASLPQATPLLSAMTPFAKDARFTRGFSDLSPLPTSLPQSRASRVASRAKHLDPGSPLAGRDPLVIKRQKDGLMVKLYCTQCEPERSDFANVQGFLNHCRISHKNDFKSHEQAAIACGRPVDQSDYFGSSQQESTFSAVATPRESFVSRQPSLASKSFPLPSMPSTPMPVFASDRPTVHALNKPNAALKDRQAPAQQIIPRRYSKGDAKENGLPTPTLSPKLSSDSETPFLSRLVQHQKAGSMTKDLSNLVAAAKKKVDLSVYDVDSDVEAVDTASAPKDAKKAKAQNVKNSKSKGASQRSGNNARRASGAPKVSKAKGGSNNRAAGLPTPISTQPFHQLDPDAMDLDETAALSPHASSASSADSNPGLVSDRDEDDEDEYDDDGALELRNNSSTSAGEMLVVQIDDGSDHERGHHVVSSGGSGVCGAGTC